MDFDVFKELIYTQKKLKPVLFGLENDIKATNEDIKIIEEFYHIRLPESYIKFVKEYGGGYFAHTVIYSCDSQSDFYLISNNSVNFVETHNFIAIADLESGDLFGYEIKDMECTVKLSIFNHEEDNIIQSDFEDIFEFIRKYGLKL